MAGYKALVSYIRPGTTYPENGDGLGSYMLHPFHLLHLRGCDQSIRLSIEENRQVEISSAQMQKLHLSFQSRCNTFTYSLFMLSTV